MHGPFGHTYDFYHIIKTSFYPLKINKGTKKNIYLQHNFTDTFAFVKHVF